MVRKVSTLAITLLMLGGMTCAVVSADPLAIGETRRAQFNPFSVRATVRPWAWGSHFWPRWGRPVANVSSTFRAPSSDIEESPIAVPPSESAVYGADEDDEPVPTSSVCNDDPPDRSPFRPAPRGSF